jgi:hypothetical protein
VFTTAGWGALAGVAGVDAAADLFAAFFECFALIAAYREKNFAPCKHCSVCGVSPPFQ